MTTHLLQIDKQGQERITSILRDPEERAYVEWLLSLEDAASGTTIFVHRLSELGHYLCMVPAAHPRLCETHQNYPPRFCGCFDCIDQRANRDLIAWAILPLDTIEDLARIHASTAEDMGSYGT